MDLVNRTPLAAELTCSALEGHAHRAGMIWAKATYRFDGEGRTTLDGDTPHPLYAEDVETELGLLPRDDFPRHDPAFEVVLLGAAYAPGGTPVEQLTVSLAVGQARRALLVTGDRVWAGEGEGATVTAPLTFERMPLTYARAFGGSAEVLIDEGAVVQVCDASNPAGRGFDAALAATRLGEALAVPGGYPQLDVRRLLPNVEDPSAPVRRWDDAPAPKCWAAVPVHYGAHALRSFAVPERAPFGQLELRDGAFHRAHPDWIIKRPAAGAPIELKGLTPGGSLTLSLPRLRVLADYVASDREGTIELSPQMLVLLPEERKLYLVYRHLFTIVYGEGTERSMRLRLEEGWQGAP